MAIKKIDINLRDEICEALDQDEFITIDELELRLYHNKIEFDYTEFENTLTQLINEKIILSKYDKNNKPPQGKENICFFKIA